MAPIPPRPAPPPPPPPGRYYKMAAVGRTPVSHRKVTRTNGQNAFIDMVDHIHRISSEEKQISPPQPLQHCGGHFSGSYSVQNQSCGSFAGSYSTANQSCGSFSRIGAFSPGSFTQGQPTGQPTMSGEQIKMLAEQAALLAGSNNKYVPTSSTIPTKIDIVLPKQPWPSDLVKAMNKWHKFLGGTSLFCGALFLMKILAAKMIATIFPFLFIAAFAAFMFCPSSVTGYVYNFLPFFDRKFVKGKKIRPEVQSVLTLTQTDRADLDTQRDLISIDDEILIDSKWITKASTRTRLYLNKAEALAVEDIIAKSKEQHRIKQSRIAQEVIGDSANQMIEDTLNDTLSKLNQSQTTIHESSTCAPAPTISPETPIVQNLQPPPQNTLYT